MAIVFADTFYWIALADRSDSAHQRALELSAAYGGSPIVTTEEVLAEFLTFFSAAPEPIRQKATQAAKQLLRGAAVRVIPQSHQSFQAALALYESRPDKGYSFVDCSSMQTMRRLEILDAFTNDHHFEQEGFVALFRSA